VPACVRAAAVGDLDAAPFPTAPIVPFAEVVHDRISLEIMRGCPRRCRFCQASAARGRPRARSIAKLLELAEASYASTGYSEISLLSLSSADYPHFGDLVARMTERFAARRVSVSLPSLHAGRHLRALPGILKTVRKSGITIAPEAGTERLRGILGKRVREEDVLEGARAAFEEGWQSLKLYFMIGLPGERDDDLDGILRLVRDVVAVQRATRTRRGGQVVLTLAPFVPKPHTPFQWFGMAERAYLEEARERIRAGVPRRRVRVKCHDPRRSALEAAIGRGDRRMGSVIAAAWRRGCRFDAWHEHFDFAGWEQAFADAGVSLDAFAHGTRAVTDVLPWAHIQAGAEPAALAETFEAVRREIDGGSGLP
jgi:radical SAM superfamily enzyme YgiQ (UPF0313 family)